MIVNEEKRHVCLAYFVKFSILWLTILAVGLFYFAEFRSSRISLDEIELNFKVFYLVIATIFCLFSYLVDVIIWKLIINIQVGHKRITFQEIFAILFSSSLLRYLPGRIWSFAAQALWFKKYGIAKSLSLYINIVCMLELVIFSGYCLLLYNLKETSTVLFLILLTVLILANIFYNLYGNSLFNRVFAIISRKTKIEIGIIDIPPRLIFAIQAIFIFSWVLVGLATLFLAKGVGLQVTLADAVPVVASMVLSWLAGCLVVITPAGLGVREGVMLLMLKPAVSVQVALLLPIVTRLFFLLTEALLGLVALYLGNKKGSFTV